MRSDGEQFVSCAYSANNILAVGFFDGKNNVADLKLWDVNNWDLIHSSQYTMVLRCLHLNADCKYLTIGGSKNTDGGEKCVVLQVN